MKMQIKKRLAFINRPRLSKRKVQPHDDSSNVLVHEECVLSRKNKRSIVKRSISVLVFTMKTSYKCNAAGMNNKATDFIHVGRGGFRGPSKVPQPSDRDVDGSKFRRRWERNNTDGGVGARLSLKVDMDSDCSGETQVDVKSKDGQDHEDPVDQLSSKVLSAYGGGVPLLFSPPPLHDYQVAYPCDPTLGHSAECDMDVGSPWARSTSAAILEDDESRDFYAGFDEMMDNAVPALPEETELLMESQMKRPSSRGWGDVHGAKDRAKEWYKRLQSRHVQVPIHTADRTSVYRVSKGIARGTLQNDGESDLFRPEEDVALDQSDAERRPIIYRYFGRSRARSRVDHVPFIVLCPNVDHWKDAGQVLAARGFSVMACETVENQVAAKSGRNGLNTRPSVEDGPDIVRAVLDALKWKNAVLIGCDNGAAAVLHAARCLNSDRIAGVVLCGDLRKAEDYVASLVDRKEGIHEQSQSVKRSVDNFIRERLECPSTIVWDGDLYALPSFKKGSKASVSKYQAAGFSRDARTVILGGGRAPHRRLPEQFGWILSRFVEQKVSNSSHSMGSGIIQKGHNHGSQIKDKLSLCKEKYLGPVSENEMVQKVFSPETMIVSGRVLAATIMYVTAANIAVYQYHNVRHVVTMIASRCQWLSIWQKQCCMFMAKVLSDDWKRKCRMLRSLMRMPFFHRQRIRDRVVDVEGISSEDQGAPRLDDFKLDGALNLDYVTS